MKHLKTKEIWTQNNLSYKTIINEDTTLLDSHGDVLLDKTEY